MPRTPSTPTKPYEAAALLLHLQHVTPYHVSCTIITCHLSFIIMYHIMRMCMRMYIYIYIYLYIYLFIYLLIYLFIYIVC